MVGSLVWLCQLFACLAAAKAYMARPEGSGAGGAHVGPQQAEASCLVPSVLQTASAFTGQEDDTPGVQAGQVESEVYYDLLPVYAMVKT